LLGLGYLDKASAQKELNFYQPRQDDLDLRWQMYQENMQQQVSSMLPNSHFIRP
jgi:hypothetical protein